ncbi:MAG: cobalt ECF transporter T component CbiQ [Nitrospiraceae bacterium]|nr:cobalt ECF transporter T component CbiQ [Nitrospiraceae bacterium]
MRVLSENIGKDHLLSRVDARLKLIMALALLGMVLSYKGVAFPVIITSICLTLCMRMKLPFRIVALRFSEPLVIAFVVVLLKFLFSGHDALFSITIFDIQITGHKDGLMDGLQIGSRIFGAVSVVALLGLSTPFTEIISALSWLRVPKGFIEVLMFAYRYIFMLFEEAMVIYNAQKNRLGYCGIRCSMNSLSTMAGSLMLRAFEHSHNTAVAMQQRGYNGSLPMPDNKQFSAAEVVVSIAFITAMGAVWTSL